MILPQKYHPSARLLLQCKPITASYHSQPWILSQSSHSFLNITHAIHFFYLPDLRFSLKHITHPIHFFYLPDLRFYLACSLVMIVSMHSHHHLKACMQLRQCVSLRTVCSRPFVRIGRQGLRLLRCFCLCGEHACLCARCFVRVCMSVSAARCLLLARCEYVCCLYYVYVCDMLASRCVLTWTGVWYLREWAYGKTGCAVYVI